jgi:tetratricopeptide (TPR) repeat protein
MTAGLHVQRLKIFGLLLSCCCFPIAGRAQTDAFQRGLAALKENKMEAALAELTAAERERPNDPLVRNFRGIALAGLGRNEEAGSEYQEAIGINPKFEDAYRNLGFLNWTQRQFEAASAALRSAVELAPQDSFAHYYLGRVELDQQHYAAGIRELETSRVTLPADPDLSMQLATALIALKRVADARKTMEQIATAQLSGMQAIRAASLFLTLHENEKAVVAIRRLSENVSSPEGWARFDLALVNLLAGNFQKAITDADEYNNSLPDDDSRAKESAQAWTIVGIAAAHLRQDEQASSAFRRAVVSVPGEEEYWLNLTRQLMELSRYADAISASQEGLTANPKSYALHLRLGAAYLAAGRYAEAEDTFRHLVAAGDPLPTSYVGLAQVLLRTGRAGEANDEIAVAEKSLGPNFLFSYFRGLALERANKPLEALGAFQEAVKLSPANAEAHLGVGKIQLNLGRIPEAIAELEETLRLNPESDQSKRLLSKAYGRGGDAKRATSFAATTTKSPTVEDDHLVGDFFVPPWRMPPKM